jgi:exosortase
VPLLVYSQDLLTVANEAVQTELASYILAIPLLIGYIVYRKRKILRAAVAFGKKREERFFNEIMGVILCFLAFMLYLYGSYTFYSLELHLISLPIFVASCILILFNMETVRAIAFPTVLLLMLVIPPLEIAFLAGVMLSNAGTQIAYTLLKFLGLPVELNYLQFSPIIILYGASGIPLEFAIQVASSGIYSLLGFTVFAVFVAYIIRGALWKKIIVLISGFLLIFALNITRVTLIMLIGYWYGHGIALELFHIFGGWVLIFVGTFLLLVFSEKILKIKVFASKTNPTSCIQCKKSLNDNQNFCMSCGRLLKFYKMKISRPDIVKMTALVLSAFLFMYIQVPVFATTQGPAKLILQTPYGSEASQILPKISNYTLRFMYRDRRFEQLYGQDMALIYAYTSRGPYPIVWVSLEISKARSPLHNWEICYYIHEQRGAFVRLDLRDVRLIQNPPVIARFYSFQVVESGHRVVKNNFTETILYWFTRAAFDTEDGVEWKYVKISVWIDAWDMNYRKVQEKLLTFGEAIAEYWEPVKSWSLLAIAVREHRSLLLTIAVSVLSFILIFSVFKWWKERKLNLKLYKRLIDDDKLIFQALYKAAKEGKATTTAITSAYHKLSGKPIETSELLKKLRYAKEANLIKECITACDDIPILIWKLNFKIKG